MTRSRKSLVCVEQTPYYHCTGRCVRRAFLCGEDSVSGRSFEHRRGWIQERLALLSRVFAIDICAYALMSNHYHLIVKLSPERPDAWSEEEVIERWTQLFTGPLLIHRYRRKAELSEPELRLVKAIIKEWRERLGDISWYMRCLNEYIARKANKEDGVTGHFWEGRFRCQALLDDIALLTGMVYVDLNPIRAAIATSVQDSAYTSAQQRFREIMLREETEAEVPLPQLAIFSEGNESDASNSIPFTLNDYLELVDETGRCCREDKRGFIDSSVPRLLTDLEIDGAAWIQRMNKAGGLANRALGAPDKLRQFAQRLRQSWLRGISAAGPLYPT